MTRSTGIFIRLGRALSSRLDDARTARERGSALISVLIFMILLAGITVSMMAILAKQAPAVYLAERGTKTVNSAQAGLQVALGQLRAAAGTPEASGAVFGDINDLPCKTTPFTGNVDSSASYSVTIKYYSVDPIDNPTAVAINCSAGHPATQPLFALVRSTGKASTIAGLNDATGTRAVQAVYEFDLAHVNVPRGRIYNLDGSMCLMAEDKTSGSLIKFKTKAQCDAADQNRVNWIYDTDWGLKLAVTLGTSAVMCIEDRVSYSAAMAVRDVELRQCDGDWNQLWSYMGSNSWVGQKSPISAGSNDGRCLGFEPPASPAAAVIFSGSDLQARGTCNVGFAPEPDVGAGAASIATKQIVNFDQFGRCMDVTGENLSASYMIAYPCKQDPTGTGTYLKWNHKWYYTEPATGFSETAAQQITVNYLDVNLATNRYCLKTAGGTATTKGYVTFQLCTAVALLDANKIKWVRYGDTGDYGSSYTFKDYLGRCIALDTTDLHDSSFAKMVVEPCDPIDLTQKWNAEPEGAGAVFGSFKEVSP